MLMLWQFVINVHSKLNLAIEWSMTGHFLAAKSVLDPRWLFLYMGVYLFAMWYSHRLAIDMNKLYLVADCEPIVEFRRHRRLADDESPLPVPILRTTNKPRHHRDFHRSDGAVH